MSQNSINAIKMLSVDTINKANSGHPGMAIGAAPILYTLYSKELNVHSKEPNWINRDRFVLAAGHGSALLYSVLHFAGYDITIEDMKQFRQLGSKTPGHPEKNHTPGIDLTSGPLGQGIPGAVGMAISESYLAATYNKTNLKLIDHYTYVLCGDGDLQEGVTQEAMSLAGKLKLNKLIVLYDSNDIQLDGPVSEVNSENTKKKYEAMGWKYIRVEQANNINTIHQAISDAKSQHSQPTIIEIKTIIGEGTHVEGTNKAHGAPVQAEGREKLAQKLQWEKKPFDFDNDVYKDFEITTGVRGKKAYEKWVKTCNEYKKEHKELFEHFEQSLFQKFSFTAPSIFEEGFTEATRVTGGRALEHLSNFYTNFMGGSADLVSSTKVKGLVNGNYSDLNRTGTNILYGVREFAMGAITNGINAHGLTRAYSGAFFVFSDYMKPAIRMAALMNVPSIFIFTHDSVAVGEDGPTHQPIEQLATLRSIPNLNVYRPADANEVMECYRLAYESKDTPSVIVLTRQNVSVVSTENTKNIEKGGYIYKDCNNVIEGVLVASGSEVALCCQAQEKLAKKGVKVNVVSVPCLRKLESNGKEYVDSLLPKNLPILAVEMSSSRDWYKYADDLINIETFGDSGVGSQIIEKHGFTAENIVERFQAIKK